MARVTITQGTLIGGEALSENGHKYYEFMSIPYAQPPVGDLRFKSPLPPVPWMGERDATKSVVENTSCQKNFMTGQMTGSEDCLYLNVYTPKLPPTGSRLLPVMFYVHGGGFIYGSGILKAEGSPEFLVENDVVVVTINYRLGVLGFLSLDIPEASGNMGLKDQVRALEWVQKNIENFGGDKDNVTIFGISAGGASVEYLMLSPTAQGLFHKAIPQSGSTLNGWAIGFQYEQFALKLADKLGYKGDRKDNLALYEFFRQVPAAELTNAGFLITETFTDKSIFFGFVPIVEKIKNGAFLSEPPYKLLKEGKFTKVPVVRGFCSMEGLLMSMMKPFAVNELIAHRNFVSYWSHELGDDEKKYNIILRDVYLEVAKSEDDYEKFALDFFGDLQFSAGVWLASIFFAKHGISEYVYKFSYDGNLNHFKTVFGLMKKGAAHGDDQGYIFKSGLVTAQPDEADVLFRSKIVKLWTNFAKTSNPTPNGSSDIGVEWPPFTAECKAYVNLDKDITTELNYEPDRMAVFEQIYEVISKHQQL